MKRILVFVLLSLSIISFGSYKLGILSFESPYSIHFSGLTEDLVLLTIRVAVTSFLTLLNQN